MYDGSALPIEENIKNTKEVVAYAHEHGVSVEGEIGSIGGAEEGVVVEKDAAMYTKPEDALHYVDETHVDVLRYPLEQPMDSLNQRQRSIMNF